MRKPTEKLLIHCSLPLMPLPPLIVCERTGRWALAWRKALRATNIRVIETRSVPECRQRLVESPGAAVSLEWRTENAESTLEILAGWDDEYPTALAMVTADHRLAEAEELAREAGAAWFVTSVRQLPSLAAVVARHAAQQPQPAASAHDRIWEQLPWGRTG